MVTVTKVMEQDSLRQELTNKNIETSFDVLENSFNILNEIEIDDLESIMTAEFAQGLSSDTEGVIF